MMYSYLYFLKKNLNNMLIIVQKTAAGCNMLAA